MCNVSPNSHQRKLPQLSELGIIDVFNNAGNKLTFSLFLWVQFCCSFYSEGRENTGDSLPFPCEPLSVIYSGDHLFNPQSSTSMHFCLKQNHLYNCYMR